MVHYFVCDGHYSLWCQYGFVSIRFRLFHIVLFIFHPAFLSIYCLMSYSHYSLCYIHYFQWYASNFLSSLWCIIQPPTKLSSHPWYFLCLWYGLAGYYRSKSKLRDGIICIPCHKPSEMLNTGHLVGISAQRVNYKSFFPNKSPTKTYLNETLSLLWSKFER